MKRIILLVNIITLFLLLLNGCGVSVIPKPPPVVITPDAKIVCLFFDDGYQNQYDEAYPVLKKYKFTATFGIITSSIGKGNDIYQYMTQDELRDLARYGMDIASHSVTHPQLLTLSDAQLHDEIFNSKEQLESLGIVVDTFIAPYYEWNNTMVDYIIAANYTCARCGLSTNETFNPSNPDPRARYHITAYAVTNESLSTFKIIVDKAGPHDVVCLVYHLISDTGPTSLSTLVKEFKKQMSYLHSANFTVVPLSDLFRQ
jgi:peptidoglycan/xylan/chitin deacetylase (PgdA/CDA1 family)